MWIQNALGHMDLSQEKYLWCLHKQQLKVVLEEERQYVKKKKQNKMTKVQVFSPLVSVIFSENSHSCWNKHNFLQGRDPTAIIFAVRSWKVCIYDSFLSLAFQLTIGSLPDLTFKFGWKWPCCCKNWMEWKILKLQSNLYRKKKEKNK